jgi:putative membrane protein
MSLLAGALALAAQAGAQPAPAAASPQTKEMFDRLHHGNISAVQHSEIAAQKATSPAVKQLATKTRDDHKRLDAELKSLAAERGVQLTPDDAVAQSVKSSVDRLRAMNGPEFDRAYAEATVADRTQQVDVLKQMRDATPGKDAKLKKWLDDAENVMEGHRNEARVALKEVQQQQRQGRTPPK